MPRPRPPGQSWSGSSAIKELPRRKRSAISTPARGAEPQTVAELSARWAACYRAVYQVPVELDDAIMDVESGWNPYAVCNKGAVGLMQLMPETAHSLGVRG